MAGSGRHWVIEEGDLLGESLVPGVERRVIIIGDVHGCYEEMQLLLDRCSFHEDRDILIFVGDLVNKGPSSVEVVRYVRNLALKGIAYAVLGNHDEAMLLMTEVSPESRPKKYSYLEEFLGEEIEWLRSLPYTIHLPSHNSVIVHAGLVPHVPLEDQLCEHMTKMRNIILPDGATSIESLEGLTLDAAEGIDRGLPWAEHWPGPQHVYFGHDARRGLQLCKYATGLDTGCCYGRQLSAVILPGNHLVQVSALRQHAPCGSDEKKETRGI